MNFWRTLRLNLPICDHRESWETVETICFNSGAVSVVEGVGDHACEYMTGGVVVILGSNGINLGSGMTGGLTYLLTDHASMNSCNADFVRLEPCTVTEEQAVRQLLIRHFMLTRSTRAALLLESGLPLPIARMQPLTLPCPVEDTWKPILQRFERAALTALRNGQRRDKAADLESPPLEVRVAPPPPGAATTSGATE